MFEFNIISKDGKSKARTGIFHTPHGNLPTPNFAFVATSGAIKGIPKEILKKLPIDYMIINTYHIFTRLHQDFGGQAKTILDEIINQKGIHKFAGYKHITASDSGGFQVFSMGFGKTHQVGKIGGLFPGVKHKNFDSDNHVKINEEGVEFEWNNQKLTLTPEKSIAIQEEIGADIIFAFDECTSPLNSKKYTEIAMERTHRWIHRCINAKKRSDQVLFAIVQGGYYEELRKKSARYMSKLDVPGFGIGGSLGKTKEDVWKVLEWTNSYLPDEKPRHLLGIGQVKDILEAVERGVDLFDCVIPTREARHKVIYTKHGKIQLQKMKNNKEILEKGCQCIACKEKISYQRLYEFFLKKDERAFIYATIHNIQFYADLMKDIQKTISDGKFDEVKNKYSQYYQ